MSRTTAISTFVAAVAAWLTISVCSPWVLSDSNAFLRGFVNHELLAFLGVLVTITLGSAAHLHLSLNQLEERASEAGRDTSGLIPVRASLKQSAFWLVGMLLLAVFLVIAKPLVVGGLEDEIAAALVNGACVLVLLFSVLILIDLTQMAFMIPPNTKKK